jgi:hypothetical protein
VLILALLTLMKSMRKNQNTGIIASFLILLVSFMLVSKFLGLGWLKSFSTAVLTLILLLAPTAILFGVGITVSTI